MKAFFTTALVVVLLSLAQHLSVVLEDRAELSFQAGQAALADAYLGLPKDFDRLSPGHYTVITEVGERIAVVRQNLPTGDLTMLVSGLPERVVPGDPLTIG